MTQTGVAGAGHDSSDNRRRLSWRVRETEGDWTATDSDCRVSGCFERSKGALRRVDKGAQRKGGPDPKYYMKEGEDRSRSRLHVV